MDYLPLLTGLLVVALVQLLSSRTDATQLDDYILDYQSLAFNPSHLHEKHSRVKRALDPYLHWNFKAYGRTFNLRLRPIQSLFTPDHHLVIDDKLVAVDTSFIYEGSLTDDPKSRVHMSILNDSIMGFIDVPGDTIYHIEPARRHLKEPKGPSIIYPESRMEMDPYRHKRHAASQEDLSCGSKAIFEKLDKMAQPVDAPRRKKKKREAYSEALPHNKYSAYYNSDVLSRKRRQLQAGKTSCFLHLRADQILYQQILSDVNNDDQKARDEILAMFAIHVNAIKDIYSGTNFVRADNDQISFRGVTFQLQRSTIMTNCQTRDSRYCTDNVDVSNFLELTSLEDHSAFCLVHTFTYRDFIGGTLGLAWVATPDSGNAGVCGGFRQVRDKSGIQSKSLNTGITTLINFQRRVPSRVSQLTFAHEVGHNFGSKHDESAQCAPYGTTLPNADDGNYIMFPSANQGNLANNDKFSSCSKDYIAKVLESMNTGVRDNCFKESNAAFCGNNVVEGDEECDCGYVTECQDQCCHARPDEGTNTDMCTKTVSSVCSPSEGVCCNSSCMFVTPGEVCEPAGDCTETSVCVLNNAICPPPTHKADKTTFCNDFNGVCMSGDCLGSICLKIDWEECSLRADSDNSNSEELCYVACQKPNSTGGCISSNDRSALDELANEDFKNLLQDIVTGKNLPADQLGVRKTAGSRCNFNKGYCDVLFQCRSIDSEGPFKRLTDLIFDPVTLEKVKDWIVDHWWAVLLMCFGGIVLMVLFVKVFGYNTPNEDPRKTRRNAALAKRQAGSTPGRGRQPDKPRSRPTERDNIYATDVPMYDYSHRNSQSSGHYNYAYDGPEVRRGSQLGAPSYPNYMGPQGKLSRGQQFDRVSVPPQY